MMKANDVHDTTDTHVDETAHQSPIKSNNVAVRDVGADIAELEQSEVVLPKSHTSAIRHSGGGTLIGESEGIPVIDEDGKLKRHHATGKVTSKADLDQLEADANAEKEQAAQKRLDTNKEYNPFGNIPNPPK